MDHCTCYPTTTILCAYCEANLCERCTEPEDLCTCPTDGSPETQAEVTAGGPPAWDTRDEHDRSL